MGQGVALTAVGLTVGLVVGGAAGKALSSLLYRVSPFDATTFAGTAPAIGGAATLTTLLAALRVAAWTPLSYSGLNDPCLGSRLAVGGSGSGQGSDYRAKPGPVTRSNALALMRAVGLGVGARAVGSGLACASPVRAGSLAALAQRRLDQVEIAGKTLYRTLRL